MRIDVDDYAFQLLKDFVRYATGERYLELVAAMYYAEDAFLARAKRLEKSLRAADA